MAGRVVLVDEDGFAVVDVIELALVVVVLVVALVVGRIVVETDDVEVGPEPAVVSPPPPSGSWPARPTRARSPTIPPESTMRFRCHHGLSPRCGGPPVSGYRSIDDERGPGDGGGGTTWLVHRSPSHQRRPPGLC